MCSNFRVALVCFVNFVLTCAIAVYIESNAYKGITIAFSPSIQKDEINSTKLKHVIQKSSELLYRATRRRSYFEEVDLLFPSSWTNACTEIAAGGIQPQGVSVYITSSQGTDEENFLRAQHSKGCGEKGEVIYMSSGWLDGDEEELFREFVQQWAIYRYGVFEEKMEPGGWPCYTIDGENWIQSGCYNIDVNVNLTLDENGLPSCYPGHFFDYINIKSSLMSSDVSPNVTEFCDGSKLLPHNPLAPTLHNRICRGKPVWSIIKESEDFRYGRNLPKEKDYIVPPVAFRCFQEIRNHLIFSIQTSSGGADVGRIVEDIRISLLRFLLYDTPEETLVNIITFNTEAMDPISLNLKKPDTVYTVLDDNVRARVQTNNICLFCGLQAAYNASTQSREENTAVVFVVFSSALQSQNLGQFIFLMESAPSRTHLIIIQDVQEDFVASNFIKAVHRTGGEVFIVPSSIAVLPIRLSMCLTSVLRNPLKIQDTAITVHQGSITNFNKSVNDVLEADVYLEGEMTYTVICDAQNRLLATNPLCSELKYLKGLSSKISCGFNATLAKEKWPQRWNISFRDIGGISPLHCFSLATVRLRMNYSDSLTVRGWINTDTIEPDQPGRHALIVYAEIMHNSVPVTDAVIHAAITSSKNSKPMIIELLDTGNGDPDIKKGDGIYSRYFTQIYNRGIHSVVIQAKGPTKNSHTRFSREVPIGSFLVVEEPRNIDYYPPNRIGDLKVTEIDHNNSVVTLQFTAPGDNYDEGTANRYEVKFSQTWTDLEEPTITIGNSESLENVINDTQILSSGNFQIITIRLPPAMENVPYYIAIQAVNKYNDTSLASNIIRIPFSKYAPIRTTEAPLVTEKFHDTTTPGMNGNSSDLTNSTETVEEGFSNTTQAWNQSSSTMELIVNASITVEESTTNSEMTKVPITGKDECNEKRIIMLASAVGAGILLLLLIANVIVYVCCMKHKKPKKLSRKASLRPPHNMTIVPKQHSPKVQNDYGFSADGNSREELKDFELDSDYTFVAGSQRLRNQNQQQYAMPATQVGNVGSMRSLARRYNIPEQYTIDSGQSTLTSEATHHKNGGDNESETYAISLGLV